MKDTIGTSRIAEYRKTSPKQDELFLFYFTKYEYLENILFGDGMIVSVLGTGNDPYEIDFAPVEDWSKFKAFTYLRDEENEKELISTMKEVTPIRVFCLSANVSSPPMWGHYAGGHTGVCLAFKLKFSTDMALIDRLKTILYRKRRISLSDCLYEEDNMIYLNSDLVRFFAHYTKASDWSHEREFKLDLDLHHLGGTRPHFSERKVDGKVRQFSRYLMPHLDGIIIGSHSKEEIPHFENLIRKYKEQNNISREIICTKAFHDQSMNKILADPYRDMDDDLYWRVRSEMLNSQKNNNPCTLVSMSNFEGKSLRTIQEIRIGGLIEEFLEDERKRLESRD